MGWVIHAVVNPVVEQLSISYKNAYLLATLAPLSLWISALALWVPSLFFNVIVGLAALGVSCSVIYHGLQALCTRNELDVATISATYTIMSAGILGWGVLLAVVWAY